MLTVDVFTVRSGAEYRVTVDGPEGHMRYGLSLDRQGVVWVRTRTHNIGGYRLERFGGKLTPASIRAFFTPNP